MPSVSHELRVENCFTILYSAKWKPACSAVEFRSPVYLMPVLVHILPGSTSNVNPTAEQLGAISGT